MNSHAACLEIKSKNIPLSLTQSMHLHRYDQFCNRLNWNLPVGKSKLEKDQFDDGKSNYIIVSEGGSHLGSFRLRDAADGTMIEQCFCSSLLKTVNFIQENRANTIEITRLVSSPALNPRERKRVRKFLLAALQNELCKRPNHFFVAVVSAPILRLLFCQKVPLELYECGNIDDSMAASVILGLGIV